MLITLCFLADSTLAQDVKPNSSDENILNDSTHINLDKNCMYGGIGFLLLYAPAYIYYERKLQDSFLKTRFSSFITVGAGIAAHWEGSSPYISAKYGLLLGKNKAHLETALGLSYFYSGDLQGSIPPVAISIGYRAHKPGEKYVFRTGVSWPESIYASWGFSF